MTAPRHDRPEVVIVAAVARNGVIGRDGGLAWHEPLDQQHFRRTTMGSPVVMGRKTWASLPERFRPLPGRRNVVVSRNPSFAAQGAEVVDGLDAALRLLAAQPRVFVIGGGELYARALPLADVLELTEIDADLDGDTRFPDWDRSDFERTAASEHTGADGRRFSFATYRRRAALERP